MKSTSKLRQVVVCLVLATGFGGLWGISAGSIGAFISSLLSGPQTYESIHILRDGTPVIETRTGSNYYNSQFRKLDGQAVDEDRMETLYGVTLLKPYRAPGLVHWPLEWNSGRIAVKADSLSTPAFWAVVRNADMPGRIYLAGYDSQSAYNVGYLGRGGLSHAVPPADEWFDVGYQTLKYDSSVVVSVGTMSWGGGNFNFNYREVGEGLFQPWTLFIRDGNTVRVVDLNDREVQTIATFDQLVDVEIVRVDIVRTSIDQAVRNIKTENRLLVRRAEQIVLYNTFDNSQTEFEIPSGLESETFNVNVLDNERLLLHVNRGYWERGNVVELQTINPNGDVVNSDTIRLVNYVPETQAQMALILVGMAPVLVVWLVGLFGVAPLLQIQNLHADTYQQGLSNVWEAWPALLLVFLVSIILAAVVNHWQKKFSRPYTGMWTALIFLTTVPGFLGYWAMHRRAPLAVCPHCGKEVPRNREACARCSEPFPEPKLTGTEVFA